MSARLRFKGVLLDSEIPTPALGKASLFYNDTDKAMKAKLDNGSVVVLSVSQELVEDIVGNLFQDSLTINVVYNDAGNIVTLDVIQTALDISVIPNVPSGNLTATTVQGALNELQTSIDDSTTDLTDHINNPTDAHDASAVSVVPTGNLSSINVQDGLEELQSDINTINVNAIEVAQDAVAAAFAAGTQDGVSVVYNDVANSISLTNTDKGSVAVSTHVGLADPHTQYLKESDNLLITPQVVRVKISDAGVGEFTSLTAALASITDADPDTKPYVVLLGAGVHTANNPVNIPSGVSLRGEGINVTTIQPLNATQHLLVPSNLTEIAFLNLKGIAGSIGSGKAAIYCEDVGDFAQVHKVSIYDFDIGIENNNNIADSSVYVEYVDINGDYSFAVKNTSNGVNANRLQLENFYTYSSGTAGAIHISSTGTTAELLINSAGLIGGTDNIGLNITNGGTLKMSDTFIQGFIGVSGVGLENLNVGAGSFIEVSALTFSDNTLDVQILNPSSSGTLFGALDKNKITIATGADFSVSFLNTDESGISFNGKLFYSQNNIQDAQDISQLIINTPTIGVISGGDLSVVSGLTVNVAAGYGYRMVGVLPNNILTRQDWTSTNFVVAANSNNFLYFNTSGVLTSNSSFPDTEQNILLGRIISDATNILYISNTPLRSNHYSNKVDRLLRQAIGPVYASGSLVVENGTRQLDITQGEYYYAEKVFMPAGGTLVSWDAFYRSVTPGIYTRIATQNTVSNSQYDNNSGILAAIPIGQYAKHSLYILGGPTEQYLLVFAQATYVTLGQAEAAELPIPPSFVTGAFARIASVIVQQGVANIIEVIDERPRIGFASSSVTGGITDHGALSGLGDDDHTQYLLASGARPLSGNLDMGANNITNVNLVDGVDISAHASRHLPNGTDPLTTGTPSSIGTANATGTANALARQDHVHAHGAQTDATLHAVSTTSNNGFMSSTDKTKLDGIATGATANQTDAFLLDRINHTGTQTVATITGLGALATLNTVGNTQIDNGAVTSLKLANDSVVTDRILANAVTNLKLSDMGANTIKGNNTGAVADPNDLSVAQVKTMLSIDNVDNTSDVNKPISTATQTALNGKANLAGGNAFTGNQSVTSGSVAVGTVTQVASSILTLDSTTQGFLIPRMTSAQRIAIASPAEGLQVFDTDLNTMCEYSGTAWKFEYRLNTTAIQTSLLVAYANITELVSLSLDAGLYALELKGIMQSTATGTGVGLKLANGTATISTIVLNWGFTQAAAGTDKMFEYSQLAVADNVTSTGVITANTNFPVFGNGVFRITAAGTIAIQIRTELAASGVSIRPDSTLMLKKIG